MRANVFTDKGLERYAGRFVWLSVNTEAAANAAFLRKYPIPALPTMLVIDPKRDAVSLRFVGGATVSQLRKMLDDVSAKTQSPADVLLSKGDALASDGKNAEALAAYRQAMEKAPTPWRNFGRASEALVVTAALADEVKACVADALALYPKVRGTPSGANIAATGLGCATGLEENDPKRLDAIATLEKATRDELDNPKLVIAGDDRSGMYMALIGARETLKDEPGALQLRREWSAFLDDAAAKAKTPAQRFVYDPHRLTAYIDLGTPEKAIPMLEQSEKEFPGDYNPPARLAIAYKAMKQYDKALEASARAVKLVYGPRKLTVLTTRADIYEAMGDKAAARKVLEDAIAYAKSLPEGQRSDRRIASFEKRIEKLQ
jgi:tetratricopeptide (TPR) repeat protein